jgi:glycosyltransferase involved in cell wall biosynthesis
MPFSEALYRNYLPLFPRAVESFDLSGFDLVVSSSHCVAKGALAPPGAPHLCYCHTPVRYAWDQFDAYFPPGTTRWRGVKRAFVERLRRWDRETAGRPTRYLANSSAVAERIRRHYGRESDVCHPPADVEFFEGDAAAGHGSPREGFLLAVGALVPYKRFEQAIEAAALTGRRLVLVGKGPEERRLRADAQRLHAEGGGSVDFRMGVSPEELRRLYRRCALFVQPGEEDFGIAAVEAMACGAPVVALARGGALDIVADGETGVLYPEEGARELAGAIERALATSFDYTRMRGRALRFSRPRFLEDFRRQIESLLR